MTFTFVTLTMFFCFFSIRVLSCSFIAFLCQVELKEYVKIGQCVYEINVDKEYSINFNPIRSVNESPSSNVGFV